MQRAIAPTRFFASADDGWMALAFDSCDLPQAVVAERFRRARRQGNAAWHWPDVAIDDWHAALDAIAGATKSVLAGAPGALSEGSSEAIGLAGYTSGMGPLLGWWLERGAIAASPGAAALLDLHLRHNRIRAARMEAQGVAAVEALLARGIAVTMLKEAHSAHAYFPDPATRPASDLDLLVHKRDATAAEAVLAGMGFAPRSRAARASNWIPAGVPSLPQSLRLVHADDPWSIDLHRSLDLYAAGAPLARFDLAGPMQGSGRWAPCAGAAVLDQPLLLLHLAAHAGAGLHNLTLARLVELVLVIRRDTADARLSWDALLAMGERIGALGYAWPALRLCEQLAPGTVPETVLDQCGRHAPPGVRRVVGPLTPATAQRVERNSVAEHFMWAHGWTGHLRLLAADLAPSRALAKNAAIYRRRAWQLLRGTLSPQARRLRGGGHRPGSGRGSA